MANKGQGKAAESTADSVRKMLAGLFKDGLPVPSHETESNDSGPIVGCAAQPVAQPPTTSAESVLEPGSFDGWDFRADPFLDHTVPPSTSVKPVLEPAESVEWGFDEVIFPDPLLG